MKQITVQNLLHTLRDKAQDLIVEYHMTDMDEQTYDARRKKIKKVIKSTERHLSWMLARKDKKSGAPCFPKNKKGNIEYLKEKQGEALVLMIQGKKFIAIDVECDYNDQSIVTEIGYTTMKNGELFSRNFVIAVPGRNIRKTNTFDYGITSVLTIESAIYELKKEMEDCEVLIGHSLENDKRYLKKYIDISLPNEFDTATISKAITGYHRRLRVFAAMFGIAALYTHNAGNDARYTMDAFLKFLQCRAKTRELSKTQEKNLYYWVCQNANK